MFTCVAVNAAGSAHHKVQLSVNMRPEFKESPSDQTLRTGQNLTLTCHAHSTPPPVITWTVNNNPYTGKAHGLQLCTHLLAQTSASSHAHRHINTHFNTHTCQNAHTLTPISRHTKGMCLNSLNQANGPAKMGFFDIINLKIFLLIRTQNNPL